MLDETPDGDYLLFAFPMKYAGCDGAPVRAVLLADTEAKPVEKQAEEIFPMLDNPEEAV